MCCLHVNASTCDYIIMIDIECIHTFVKIQIKVTVIISFQILTYEKQNCWISNNHDNIYKSQCLQNLVRPEKNYNHQIEDWICLNIEKHKNNYIYNKNNNMKKLILAIVVSCRTWVTWQAKINMSL